MKKNKYILFGCFSFNLCIFLLLCILGNPVFATNDDYRMRLIISGSYTGIPSCEAVFISSILAGIIAGLYKIFPQIEWYGFFTMFSMFIPVWICEFVFLKRTKNLKELIERIGIIIVFTVLILQKHILLPQFTITAAFWSMLAMTAIIETFNIYNESEEIKVPWIVLSLISAFLGCLVRKKVFYMCIPMLILFIIVVWSKYKNFPRKIIYTLGASIIGIVLITESSFLILNEKAGYKNFSEFNKVRSDVYDYNEIPMFYENEQFFNKLGIDEAAWNNLKNRTFDISDSLNTKNMVEVAVYADTLNNNTIIPKIWNAIDQIRLIFTGKTTFFQLLGIVIILCAIFLNNSWEMQRKLKKLVASYLIYIILAACVISFAGRIMDRIIESLLLFFIGSVFACSSNSIQIAESEWIKIWKVSITNRCMFNIGTMILSILIMVANQYTLQRDSTAVRSIVTEKSECIAVLTNYMKDKKDDFLFYNTLDFIAGSEKVFTDRHNEELNIDSLGNWNVFSPNYYKRNNNYGFSSAIQGFTERNNVYYAEIGDFHANINSELEKRGVSLVWIDKIETGMNTIHIYRTEPLK